MSFSEEDRRFMRRSIFSASAEIRRLGRAIEQIREELHVDLTQIQADVAAETTVDQSAITLLESLAAEIRTNQNDPAALEALAQSIESNTATLSAAVTANTPAPAPAPAPVPAAFVSKIAGEVYTDYVTRVEAWNSDPANSNNQIVAADETSWDALTAS